MITKPVSEHARCKEVWLYYILLASIWHSLIYKFTKHVFLRPRVTDACKVNSGMADKKDENVLLVNETEAIISATF